MFKAAVKPRAEAGCLSCALMWFDLVPKELLEPPPRPVEKATVNSSPPILNEKDSNGQEDDLSSS